MADEPRRSGRATKGQHTKDRDVNEDGSVKKKGKGKGAKAKPVEEEEEEEAEEKIRCVCGTYEEEEDVPRAMICCDNCSAWQHNGCMGLPEEYEVDKYFCEQCRPEDHKDLLAAIARGEKPWEASLERQAAKSKKKGGRKGRKSGGARTSEVPSHASQEIEATAPTPTPTPAPATTGQKRKLEESPSVPELKNKKIRGAPSADTNGASSTPERKPSVSQTPSRAASRQPSRSEIGPPVVGAVKELGNKLRSSAASTLIKMVEQQVKEATKQGSYAIPTGSTSQDVGNNIGLQIEHAMYHLLSGGNGEPNDVYKAQLRTITFNIKKNHALGVRLLKGEVSPHALASMKPEEMASDEQKRKDAETIKELEKQHTIVEEQGPRIRRTHKGEEYVDESQQVAAESENSHAPAPARKPSGVDMDVDVKSPDIKSPYQGASNPRSGKQSRSSRPSVDTTRRQSSANFDIDKVWSGVQGSPDVDGQRFGELPRTQSPTMAVREPAGPGATVDADIDALLKDEEAESPPYSPKETAEDDGTVWRGYVNGGTLGKFDATAKFAAGASLENNDKLRLTYDQLIPSELVIGGRIQPSKADEYLCGLEYSQSSDLVIVYMPEPTHDPDKAQFNKLFGYFKTKERYGVGVQHSNPAIKDIYLIPLDKGQEMPPFLGMLEHDFSDHAQERMLLIPVVIKNSELPHNKASDAAGAAAVTAASPGGGPTDQTPITPHLGNFDPQHIPYNQNGPGPYNGTPRQPAQAYGTPVPGPGYGSQPHFPTNTPVPQGPSPAMINAQKILGPLANSPSVLQLCAQVPEAGEQEFAVIKECIEKNPEAANSLEVLTGALQHSIATQPTK